uniref:Uncharacterized protein n=1 Tax=Acrobeloides nanus TaxID=290746 RepID=A0A914ED89_9BILA
MSPRINSKVGAFVLALFILHLIVILSIIKYFTIAAVNRGLKNETSRIRVLSTGFKNHDFWENFIDSSEEDEDELEERKTELLSTIKVVNSKDEDEYEITGPLLTTTKIHITPIQIWTSYQTSHETTNRVQDLTTTTPATEKLPTLVTALLDIGRGKWRYYARTISIYHNYMFHVLSLKLPLVAFVDEHSYEFVLKTREKLGMLDQTKIWNITLEDLPLYRHINVIRGILENELTGRRWQDNWDNATQTHPEARSPEYDLVVNSKPYFLYNASTENPFDTSNFIWLDAGYGQGKPKNFPDEYIWEPNFPKDKVSLTKITPFYDPITRYTIDKLYRQDWSVVSGGFLAGNKQAVQRYYRYYHWKVVELLFKHQMIDDDQTILVMLINEYPELFNVLHGGWFDAFKLFQ